MFAQKDFEIDEMLRTPLMAHLSTVEICMGLLIPSF